MGISIGPETVALFKKSIMQAKTLFFNGAPGFARHPETLEGTRGIFQALQQNHATKIIGGGDTVALARYFKCGTETGFFSTGGGVILAYLSGRKLPGLW
jgi:phosphoglycerate kinase